MSQHSWGADDSLSGCFTFGFPETLYWVNWAPGQFLFPAEILVPGKVDSVPSIAFPGGLVWMQGRQEEGTASFQLERTATAITGPTLHQQWR